jgi:hypothetical protein
VVTRHDRRGKWASRLTALTLGAGLTGCAGPTFWDDVTARDYKFKSAFSASPEPIVVLRESTDGDARAKAMRAIKEPKANGGGDALQDEVVKILTTTAVGDPQPLCRSAAIQALGRFKDPRVIPALIQAYDAAGQLPNEISGAVQTQALTALGETHQPAAVNFLIQVANKPTPAEMSDREKQVGQDNRLAAVRALKNFDGSAEVAAAMGKIAETERNVALRDRARETYAKVTGKEAPTQAIVPDSPQPENNGVQLTGARSEPKP